jgi:predicted transcriptional regulator
MPSILRLPALALGELEQAVLEMLWSSGPSNPASVHATVGEPRNISINTVSSALKRLYEKELLRREKVSHSYVYEAAVTRAELQGQMIGAIANRFPESDGKGLLAAFVDYAEADGEDTLRQLEALIAERLANTD